ncbi:hypothetical protein ACFL1Y_00115 [Patescibacteria group bacterium]
MAEYITCCYCKDKKPEKRTCVACRGTGRRKKSRKKKKRSWR